MKFVTVNKKNSIEFPFEFLYYIYNYYYGYCKGTPPFLPLNGMTTLQSYLSLFTSDT